MPLLRRRQRFTGAIDRVSPLAWILDRLVLE